MSEANELEAIDWAVSEIKRLRCENALLRDEVEKLKVGDELYQRGYEAMGACDISEYLALCGEVRKYERELEAARYGL